MNQKGMLRMLKRCESKESVEDWEFVGDRDGLQIDDYMYK